MSWWKIHGRYLIPDNHGLSLTCALPDLGHWNKNFSWSNLLMGECGRQVNGFCHHHCFTLVFLCCLLLSLTNLFVHHKIWNGLVIFMWIMGENVKQVWSKETRVVKWGLIHPPVSLTLHGHEPLLTGYDEFCAFVLLAAHHCERACVGGHDACLEWMCV